MSDIHHPTTTGPWMGLARTNFPAKPLEASDIRKLMEKMVITPAPEWRWQMNPRQFRAYLMVIYHPRRIHRGTKILNRCTDCRARLEAAGIVP